MHNTLQLQCPASQNLLDREKQDTAIAGYYAILPVYRKVGADSGHSVIKNGRLVFNTYQQLH